MKFNNHFSLLNVAYQYLYPSLKKISKCLPYLDPQLESFS